MASSGWPKAPSQLPPKSASSSSSDFKLHRETPETPGSSILVNPPKKVGSEKDAATKEFMVDLGYPVLNRVVESFLRIAGVGALQAISRDALHLALEGRQQRAGSIASDAHAGPVSCRPQCCLAGLINGGTSKQSVEKMIERASKESLQWGLAVGVLTGVNLGLEEVCGKHDWRHAALAGALAGVALSLTGQEKPCLERAFQSAIVGSAIATATTILHK